MNTPVEPVCVTLNVPSRAEAVPFFHYPASRGHILGIFEGRTYPIVKDIGPVATIVDIGANVGAASVMLAAHYPDADVHAFEPGPATAALLARNAAGFPRIRVHAHGLGPSDGHLRLYRSRWDPMSASVLPSAENTDGFDVVEIRRAGPALAACGIAAVDVLKIDTEGCELPILEELAAFVPAAKVIYLEFHSEADRLRIDQRLAATHVLAFASVRHPHRGDVCYVHRDTPFARRHEPLAIEGAG
jgi:FkbM family methyltransferase